MEHSIETVGLTRVFGQFVAVDGLDLSIKPGTFFGFLGPNGAGKSTTIRMLTGLLRMTSGKAIILGHDLARDPVMAKRRVGVVPEEFALFDRLTGEQYLFFVGRMYGMKKGLIRERSEELLALMELDEDRKKLIVDYSHGMKKKTALCAALIHGPEVLFLDEPFEGIDAIASRLIKDILHSLIRSGVTIFLTSHILEIVEKLCSEIAIIHKGKLVAQGALADLRKGIAIEDGDHRVRTMTLEEVFLNLVGLEHYEKKTLSWLNRAGDV